MTYEEALAKLAAEGAIRAFRLSDSTAYVYRLKDNHYQVRTLTAANGNWEMARKVASRREIEPSADGWYPVEGLPKRAQPILLEAAMQNPGYSQLALRQCYTCKQFKPESEFERPGTGGDPHRNWECNECYSRRQRELAAYGKAGARKGDLLDRQTLASPPPPQGKI
ncbi:MAG: hypothetical protein WEA61_03180 [Anaerolineales bacterium]